MTKRKPPRVLEMEGGYVVAGTQDIDVALDLLVEAEKIDTPFLACGVPFADELTPADREAWRKDARTGWAHCGPCVCGDDHSWDLFHNNGPGPGRFEYVAWWW